MENPHEERQSLLLQRIIKNVELLNEALSETCRSVEEVARHNQSLTIASELWEGYRRNAAFNLQNMDAIAEEQQNADNASVPAEAS